MKWRIMGNVLLLMLMVTGCEKDFLNERADKGLLVPTTLTDFRALMDNMAVMNMVPALQRISNDELVTTTAGIASLAAIERSAYLWEKDVYQGQNHLDWETPYKQVFYANVVLDGLEDLTPLLGQTAEYDALKGTAYFHRAFALFHLAQLFAAPYETTKANQLLGIPLPISADVNKIYGRSSLQETYSQLLSDLQQAAQLLPLNVAYKSRPSKLAAWAMLARLYLIMGNYTQAESHAKKVLEVNNKLLNYNAFSTTSTSPFPGALPNGNDEVVFNAVLIAYFFSQSALVGHNPDLYNSYGGNDLRKQLYFIINANNVIRPKNSYSENGTFAGIANDELYLIVAECLARRNETTLAMGTLNQLLVTRWKTNTYVPMTATNADEALSIILRERRKELVTNKGVLRWSDLRRLNLDGRFATTLTRNYDNQTYTLVPNDKRYVFPIPDNEINANGIPQNER